MVEFQCDFDKLLWPIVRHIYMLIIARKGMALVFARGQPWWPEVEGWGGGIMAALR